MISPVIFSRCNSAGKWRRAGTGSVHLSAEGLAGLKGDHARSGQRLPDSIVRGVPLSAAIPQVFAVAAAGDAAGNTRWRCEDHREGKTGCCHFGECADRCASPITRFCHRNGIGFTHWVQDNYSRRWNFVLRRNIGAAASVATFPFQWLDKWVARNSDAVVAISPGFRTLVAAVGAREVSR